MFFIRIWNRVNDKVWQEQFDDYESFKKRFYRLKYSKKLVVTSRSLLEGEV